MSQAKLPPGARTRTIALKNLASRLNEMQAQLDGLRSGDTIQTPDDLLARADDLAALNAEVREVAHWWRRTLAQLDTLTPPTTDGN